MKVPVVFANPSIWWGVAVLILLAIVLIQVPLANAGRPEDPAPPAAVIGSNGIVGPGPPDLTVEDQKAQSSHNALPLGKNAPLQAPGRWSGSGNLRSDRLRDETCKKDVLIEMVKQNQHTSHPSLLTARLLKKMRT